MKYVIRVLSQAVGALPQRRALIFGSTGVLLIITLTSVYMRLQKSNPPVLVQSGAQESNSSDVTLTTVVPELVSSSSSIVLLGTILSHETANIYPRRDGIVEDIFVDIGDTVHKNQVVALLLSKGVEGQSAALIAEKNARKAQAESNLSTAKQVAEETVISARQKIREKETELLIAQREQEQIIETFAESEANILQKQDQAFIAVQNARQIIEMIMLSSNSRTRNYIDDYDVIDTFGQLESNDLSVVKIVEEFNALLEKEAVYSVANNAHKTGMIDEILLHGSSVLTQAIRLLQSTPSSPSDIGTESFSHQELSNALAKVIAAQDSVLKAKERLEDSRNEFQTMVAAEPELYRAYRSGNAEGVKSNKVLFVQSQIETSYNSLALTEANQHQIVEHQESMLGIANAVVQSEIAQSGHRQIRSPFAGTVSKRFIDVGQIVMPSMSAFELTDVPTSLAKKAKSEIRFGLPEHLISALDVGDSVAFFLQANETEEYVAEVTRKSPQVDMATHTVTVQAKVPDDLNLPHQSSVRIRLTDEKKPVFRVPSSSVKRENDRNLLWILDPETEKPMQIDVSVIAEDGEFAELTGALSGDSKIILDPPDLFLSQDQQ